MCRVKEVQKVQAHLFCLRLDNRVKRPEAYRGLAGDVQGKRGSESPSASRLPASVQAGVAALSAKRHKKPRIDLTR